MPLKPENYLEHGIIKYNEEELANMQNEGKKMLDELDSEVIDGMFTNESMEAVQYCSLSELCEQIGDYKKAVKYGEKAVDLRGSLSDVIRLLGAYESSHEYDKGIAFAEEEIKKHSDNKEALLPFIENLRLKKEDE